MRRRPVGWCAVQGHRRRCQRGAALGGVHRGVPDPGGSLGQRQHPLGMTPTVRADAQHVIEQRGALARTWREVLGVTMGAIMRGDTGAHHLRSRNLTV